MLSPALGGSLSKSHYTGPAARRKAHFGEELPRCRPNDHRANGHAFRSISSQAALPVRIVGQAALPVRSVGQAVLGVGLFEKTPRFQALSPKILPQENGPSHKQLLLLDFQRDSNGIE